MAVVYWYTHVMSFLLNLCLAILLWNKAHKKRVLTEEGIRKLLQEFSVRSDEGRHNDLNEAHEFDHILIKITKIKKSR